jgi:hypothetical protein
MTGLDQQLPPPGHAWERLVHVVGGMAFVELAIVIGITTTVFELEIVCSAQPTRRSVPGELWATARNA